ncbi:MAG: leucyl aminopeptidase [Fimbriimonadaceae bacterium]|nr:leucyl aminopeptidase [Fimbriimonadaceae bacterium]
MILRSVAGPVDALSADALVVAVYQDAGLLGAAAAVDTTLDGLLGELLASGALSGQRGTVRVVQTPRAALRRVVTVGLGKPDLVTLEVVRRAVGAAWRAVRGEHAQRIVVALPGASGEGMLEPVQAAETVVEAALLAEYRFDRYRQPADQDAPELHVYSLDAAAGQAIERGLVVGEAKAAATNLARDLVNTGPSEMRPVDLAAAARALAAETGLQCTVLDEAALRAAGCHLLLAVNRGSEAAPALIVLEHHGGATDAPTLGLVGKGVCFDSGGLSIKSADSMMTMKGDMSGAAAVLGAMGALARLRVPLNVTGVVAAVQNLVGAHSIMPGDVVTGLAGKSVEILNTDAEGRLILADALTYATATLGLAPVVDIATLTGACMRALGPFYAGVFGSDRRLLERIRQVGLQSGEKFWELPLDEEYGELMRGSISDLKNISGEASGGASSAAMFLQEFVGSTPWAHLDIAGHGIAKSEQGYQPQGATGYGARTLVNLCLSLAKRGLEE